MSSKSNPPNSKPKAVPADDKKVTKPEVKEKPKEDDKKSESSTTNKDPKAETVTLTEDKKNPETDPPASDNKSEEKPAEGTESNSLRNIYIGLIILVLVLVGAGFLSIF